MHSLHNKILILGLLFIFTSCSTNKNFFIEEEFQKNSISDGFSFVPIDNSWVFENSSSNLNPREKEIFMEGLQRSLATYTANNIHILNSDEELRFERTEYKPALLKGNDIVINVNIPSEQVLNELKGRYVLFFEDYSFRTKKITENAGSSYAGHEAKTYNALSLNTEFFVWDKEGKRAISWGIISHQTKVGPKPESNDYRIVIEKVAKDVIDNSVFR